MKPLIKWGLWQRRWSIMWWSIGLVAFIALELSVYSSIKSQATQLNAALEHMPSTARSLFGASSDLFSPVGYLSSRLFYLLLPLMLSILSIGLGSSLIAREESDGTLELLLSRPISRGKLVLAKTLCGLSAITIVATVTTVSILSLVKLVGLAVPLPFVAFAALMAIILSLLFGALAFAIAALGRLGRGASIGVASLIGLGSYIISSLETNVHWLGWPAKFLPYHYYDPTLILNGNYTWRIAATFSLITLALGIIAWLAFRRRDLVNN